MHEMPGAIITGGADPPWYWSLGDVCRADAGTPCHEPMVGGYRLSSEHTDASTSAGVIRSIPHAVVDRSATKFSGRNGAASSRTSCASGTMVQR